MFTRSGALSVSSIHIPKIVIKQVALEKMKAYVEYCNKEIGWLGTATLSNHIITIHDMFLFKQEVHETTCEINEEAVAKWYEDILNNNENGIEIVNTMRVWGHSHVNMDTSPSSQDDIQFKELAKNVDDFFIRIIANKKGKLTLDLYDAKTGVIFNNMDWSYELSIDTEQIKAEIKEKVTEKKYPTTTSKTSYYNTYYGARGWENDYDYDWDDAYPSKDKANKTEQADKTKIIYSWLQVETLEELMAYGFTDEDFYKIDSMISASSVIEYLKKTKIDEACSVEEAHHLMDFARAYVYEMYGM